MSSVARPLVSEATTPAPAADAASGEGSAATGARDEGEAKAAIAQRAEPSIKAERNFFAGKIGRNHEIGDSPVAVASFDGAAVDPLREASAALDDRDYMRPLSVFLRRSDGRTSPRPSRTRIGGPRSARILRKLRGFLRRSARKEPLPRR